MRAKGPACVWAADTRSRRAGVLAALLLDRNCGAMVAEVLAAGPVYWQC